MRPRELPTKAHYEVRARILQALAHPTRLLLMDVLRQREVCVCDLTGLVGADQSTVSKHLAILRNAGLIESRKEGPMNLYRARCVCLDGFFDCVERVLRDNLKTQQRVTLGT